MIDLAAKNLDLENNIEEDFKMEYRHRSREEKNAIVDRIEVAVKSGVSVRDACQAEGISYDVLPKWRKALGRQLGVGRLGRPPKKATPTLVTMTAPAMDKPSPQKELAPTTVASPQMVALIGDRATVVAAIQSLGMRL